MRLIAFLSTVLFLISSLSYGEDLSKAEELYKKRGEDIENVVEAIELAETIASENKSEKNEKYWAALKFIPKATYFLGLFTDENNDKKAEIFKNGMDSADRVLKEKFNVSIDEKTKVGFRFSQQKELASKTASEIDKGIVNELADLLYLKSINWLRWGLIKAKFAQLKIINYALLVSIELDEEANDYGARRAMAKAAYKQKKRDPNHEEEFENSYENTLIEGLGDGIRLSRIANANVYYAQSLHRNGEQDKAKKILQDLVSFKNNPEKINPNRVPETMSQISFAESLLDGSGNWDD